MFEEDAEEIANKKLCSERICYNHCNFNSPKHHRCGEWHRCYEIAKEAAQFSYNKAKEDANKMKSQFLELCNLKDMRIAELEKANEWHYVKDGDVPKKSISVLAYFKGEDVSLLECLYIPDEGFKHPIFSEWYEPTAWIEIEKILPKELEKC